MILFGIICLMSVHISSQTFLGGTINWFKFPQPGPTRVRFTYRLTWEKGTGPCGQNCSSADLYKTGTVPSSLSTLHWQCISGCSSVDNISDINTDLTSVSSDSSGWEQGEKYFFHTNPGTLKYTVRLDGIPWAVPATGTGRLVTTVDLRIRNDSKLPNCSPVAAVPPTVGIPFGCPTTIILPVEDPDADDLQARLATPDECGGACTSLPKFILKPSFGHLIVDARAEYGYKPGTSYRVTLMIEDFPTYTIEIGNDIITPRHPISKVPLQFTIRVIDDPQSCVDNGMKFVFPTRKDGYRISYPGIRFGVFRNGVYLQSDTSNPADFMASLPAGMKYAFQADDRNRTDVRKFYPEWNPPMLQSADNIMCVWGKLKNGITTDSQCVVGLINDFDDCVRKNIICENNGTCINLWHRTTCKCPHGFKPPNCTDAVTCADFPCKNNGTCVDTGTAFSCTCAPGYTGVDCEIEIDECASNPCKNGGTCVNDIGRFSCSCIVNQNDTVCDGDAKESLLSKIWPTVVASVCGAAAAVAFGACCWWCLFGSPARKRKEKKKVKSAPNELKTFGVQNSNLK